MELARFQVFDKFSKKGRVFRDAPRARCKDAAMAVWTKPASKGFDYQMPSRTSVPQYLWLVSTFYARVLGRVILFFTFHTGASVLKMGEEANADMMAARERMIARRFGGDNATRTGGVRRKKKNVHKTATSGECFFLRACELLKICL